MIQYRNIFSILLVILLLQGCPLLTDNDEPDINTTPETETTDTDPQSTTEEDKDTDGDGINDSVDNCPAISNPDQTDVDEDGFGDFCDDKDDRQVLSQNEEEKKKQKEPVPFVDKDGDTVADAVDNCPAMANPGQADVDNDGFGDVCDGKDNRVANIYSYMSSLKSLETIAPVDEWSECWSYSSDENESGYLAARFLNNKLVINFNINDSIELSPNSDGVYTLSFEDGSDKEEFSFKPDSTAQEIKGTYKQTYTDEWGSVCSKVEDFSASLVYERTGNEVYSSVYGVELQHEYGERKSISFELNTNGDEIVLASVPNEIFSKIERSSYDRFTGMFEYVSISEFGHENEQVSRTQGVFVGSPDNSDNATLILDHGLYFQIDPAQDGWLASLDDKPKNEYQGYGKKLETRVFHRTYNMPDENGVYGAVDFVGVANPNLTTNQVAIFDGELHKDNLVDYCFYSYGNQVWNSNRFKQFNQFDTPDFDNMEFMSGNYSSVLCRINNKRISVGDNYVVWLKDADSDEGGVTFEYQVGEIADVTTVEVLRENITFNGKSVAEPVAGIAQLEVDITNGVEIVWGNLGAVDYTLKAYRYFGNGSIDSTTILRATVTGESTIIPAEFFRYQQYALQLEARFEDGNGNSSYAQAEKVVLVSPFVDETVGPISLADLPILAGQVGKGSSTYTINDVTAGASYRVTVTGDESVWFNVEDGDAVGYCYGDVQDTTGSCVITISDTSSEMKIYVYGYSTIQGSSLQLAVEELQAQTDETAILTLGTTQFPASGRVSGSGTSIYTIAGLEIGTSYTFLLSSTEYLEPSSVEFLGGCSYVGGADRACYFTASATSIEVSVAGPGNTLGAEFSIDVQLSQNESVSLNYPGDFDYSGTVGTGTSTYTVSGLADAAFYQISLTSATAGVSMEANNDIDSCWNDGTDLSCRLASDGSDITIYVSGTEPDITFTLGISEVVADFVAEGSWDFVNDVPGESVAVAKTGANWLHDGTVDFSVSIYSISGLTIGQTYQFSIDNILAKDGSAEMVFAAALHYDGVNDVGLLCEIESASSYSTCLFVANADTVLVGVSGEDTSAGAQFSWTVEESLVSLHTIETFPNAGGAMDPELYLYHSSDLLNEVAYNDDFNGLYPGLNYELLSGETYYIRINDLDSGSAAGAYSIRISNTGPGGSSIVVPLDSTGEPNDDSADATTLELNVIQDHTLTSGDIDWFKFTVPVN